MMVIKGYDLIPLNADTEIKPFKSIDKDLNGFLFDDSKKYLEQLMAVAYLLEDSTCGNTVAYVDDL
ncbi:MAG: hypothetical protein LUC88_09095 [Prevotella sp.]|nr:hypothetical protein [Prevotella sp.]